MMPLEDSAISLELVRWVVKSVFKGERAQIHTELIKFQVKPQCSYFLCRSKSVRDVLKQSKSGYAARKQTLREKWKQGRIEEECGRCKAILLLDKQFFSDFLT